MVFSHRFAALDGWRGLSILLVLATHFLPLGPKAWQLNATAGPAGMALFFTLSGFLITNFLLHNANLYDFLIRRFMRVLPLAWLCSAIALIWQTAGGEVWAAHFLFYANWPPMQLTEITGHLWSLCVEVQFYVGVALLFWVGRARGLLLLPIICIAVTLLRVIDTVPIAINTYYRVDEILAGGILSLIYLRRPGFDWRGLIEKQNPYVLGLLFFISCHPESGFMNYFRPYLAALLVGITLFRPASHLNRLLGIRALAYIAAVSYALYVIHPLLAHTWLGSGQGWEKYAKRPLLFLALFALAHLSTFHFEHHFIALGKMLSSRWLANRPRGAPPADRTKN